MYIIFHSNRCATQFFCKLILTATNTSWSLGKISLSFSAYVLMYFPYFLFVRWYYSHDWIIILLLYKYCITLLKSISYLHTLPKKEFLKLHNYTKKLYHLCFISSTFGKYLIEYNEMLGMTKKAKQNKKQKNQNKTNKTKQNKKTNKQKTECLHTIRKKRKLKAF